MSQFSYQNYEACPNSLGDGVDITQLDSLRDSDFSLFTGSKMFLAGLLITQWTQSCILGWELPRLRTSLLQ